MKQAERRMLEEITAGLSRAVRYDDESIVHEIWARQRYDCGCYAGLGAARKATVRTAWHEAGHAVAALAVGASFSSASIRHSHRTEGRVHGVAGTGELGFVVDAAGQIAEQLMDWTLPDRDQALRQWLASWRSDGGDAARFRRGKQARFGDDECGAWRYSEQLLRPLRLSIRQVARALLIHPRHLPYPVVAALADVRSPARPDPAVRSVAGAGARGQRPT
jgi:hypothetical protein